MTQRDAADWVSALVRADVRATAAYHVADARGLVKLDAMENPFALPAALQSLLAGRVAAAALNRYPDPQATALSARIRSVFGIDPRWGILFGNGSKIHAISSSRCRSATRLSSPSCLTRAVHDAMISSCLKRRSWASA